MSNPHEIKYSPKNAAYAMLDGKIFRQAGGYVCFWDNEKNAFIAKERAGLRSHTIGSFTDMYEEIQEEPENV